MNSRPLDQYVDRALEYDPNQFTISHFAHELLVANIVACAGT